ncbi:MAG: transglycosylase domain-containing protein [Deferribacterales bacterium]
MTLKRFLILTMAVCLLFLAGIGAVLKGERSALERCVVDLDDILKGGREGKSLTIYSADGYKIYEQVYEKTAKLPAEMPEDVMYMVKFAGENLFTCDIPDTAAELKLLRFHGVPAEGLNNCIILNIAEKALASKGEKTNSLRIWKTASDIISRYGERKLLLSYMENTYMQNDIWGIEAASQSYFGHSVRFAPIEEKAWLVSVLTLGHMPDDDIPAFYKRKDMLSYRLYENGMISYDAYQAASKHPEYALHRNVDTLPEYTSLILEEMREKGIRTDRQLVVHANIRVSTINAANDAISKRLVKYPEGVNIAMAVVNYETGGVEALAANDKWQYRTMEMRRQIGSTFKPIVYLTAMTEGAMPNEIIIDKQYKYNLGNYTYAPANFEDYYMGSIPLRFGLVHSLNNATIRLAKTTGLRKVGQMAVDLGMKARIKPYLAMPLGIFPITPLNLAKVYSAFGTYGVRREIGFINRIVNAQGEEVYIKRELPKRVAPERETYQVIYMMKDVVRRGTARGSGLITGTAAKTGTTDEYRDAWTVALFPPYAVVCWVGFDDHRSMGDEGTGGGRAAPVIAEFQKIVKQNVKKIDFNVPQGIVFKRVDTRSGAVVGKGCSGGRSYTEAFLEENVPETCEKSRTAFETTNNNQGS